MVGYVLLIVIAVGLSVLVFSYLKFYVPKDMPQCPEDVSLSIEEASCDSGNVHVTLKNRGLFKVSGAYIRIGDGGRIFKKLLNEKNVYFPPGGLGLGDTWESEYYSYDGIGEKTLEVEPAVFVDDKLTLCSKAVVTQGVTCTGPAGQATVTINSPQDQDIYIQGYVPPVVYSTSGVTYCLISVDGGQNKTVPCGDQQRYTFILGSVGLHTIEVFGNNTAGLWAKDKVTFRVDADTGQMIITILDPTLSKVYYYLNTLLYMPINYSVYNAVSCNSNIINNSGHVIGQVSNLCRVAINNPGFGFDNDGSYTLNVTGTNITKSEKLVKFNMLVDPEIAILKPNRGGDYDPGCAVPFLYNTTTRRYPLRICYVHIFKDNVKTGEKILDCNNWQQQPLSLNAGDYVLRAYANDTTDRSSSSVASFHVTNGCSNGGSDNGGWNFDTGVE